MKRFFQVVGVLAVALAVAAWLGWRHLTEREAIPETSDFALDLAELRRLARSVPGPPPLRVESELVGEAALPRAGVFAGESFDDHVMAHQVFKIVYPNRTILLDTGYSKAFSEDLGAGFFDAEARERVDAAMAEASAVLISHEHGDHLEGAARVSDPADLAARLVLTSEQLANTARLDEVDLPAELRAIAPLEYDRPHVFAPGLVLIKAAGHTPGSQIFYVRLADDREFLFLGDVAWHIDQIRELHYRPRLVTDWFLNEDRAAVMAQFRTLHDLLSDSPGLIQVPSHDRELRALLVERGALTARFSN